MRNQVSKYLVWSSASEQETYYHWDQENVHWFIATKNPLCIWHDSQIYWCEMDSELCADKSIETGVVLSSKI